MLVLLRAFLLLEGHCGFLQGGGACPSAVVLPAERLPPEALEAQLSLSFPRILA